ncbi:hypothetical protein PRIP_00244 [Listeria riparia FSL S10-1204]|uniref:Uncharacterized protein n=1 Tax=Listeria riparia FSL S10-1204 TaxID=1265816 RepID=W7DBU6_9LIST|nr:hypothetical protein PRIP_00244 [Listeria riparia FSL S10-1204]
MKAVTLAFAVRVTISEGLAREARLTKKAIQKKKQQKKTTDSRTTIYLSVSILSIPELSKQLKLLFSWRNTK